MSKETSLAALKERLSGERKEIFRAHRAGGTGYQTCASLSRAMDAAIRSACSSLGPEGNKHAAVLGLGGYGRAELSPFSDVDVMILCGSGGEKSIAADTARTFLHVLWDAGIDVGHSVRTVEEAEELHGKSLDSWISMLESRFICGNERLATSFFERIRRRVQSEDRHWLVAGILAELQSRHQRYGNSVKLLEPNVKKSAGGLRDLHALFWLFRGTDPEFFFPISSETPATSRFIGLLKSRGLLGETEYVEISNAAQFLLRTRHEMHYLRESLHDTLEYDLQLKVAEDLGFPPGNGSSAVEVFMRSYYLHVRTLDRLHRRLSRPFREAVEPATRTDDLEAAGEHFLLGGGMLSARPTLGRITDAGQVFEAFLHVAENDADLDFRLRAMIEESGGLVTAESGSVPELATMFRRILASRRAGFTLRLMNELGILGRYIPEFGDLVAFFQHNVYHYFTADEHTLIAIMNVERLREEGGIMREVFRNLPRKDLLYMAILLHDIAKPHGVADHEIRGVEMARTILRRLGMQDLEPDVAFLVRNHLVMEQVAFRRNIHDPQTIKEFAALFDRREQLDYLYLLTYADLSAVNINVWTDWKASMLRDLYLHTLEVVRRKLSGAEVDRYHASKREVAIAEVVDRLEGQVPREIVESHLSSIGSDAYAAVFTDEEIAAHIRAAREGGAVATLFKHASGHTEVTVVGRDAPFVLSHCCAVLAANDANIFDANIFTRDDGVIIDRFRVSDATTGRRLEQRVCGKITADLQEVTAGRLDVKHLFAAHRRRWKRKGGRPANPSTRIDVEFEDNPRFTIIDVYAPDSVGFLFRVTETMSRLGLDIHFAKIATRLDGVVDAFYVLDREGNPITGPSQRGEIRAELLRTVKLSAEESLESS
jgi:[protein-PII] uridylyltransferase